MFGPRGSDRHTLSFVRDGRAQSGPASPLAYYRTHFLESLRPDAIVCLECGKLRKTLGTHVVFMHDMTLDDYRERWGFNRQAVFIAASSAEKLRRLAFARKLGADASAAFMARVGAARRGTKQPMRLQARLAASASKKALYASGWQPRRFRKVDDRTLRRLARQGVDVKRIRPGSRSTRRAGGCRRSASCPRISHAADRSIVSAS
ncbi:MAG: MucR family transcriptional regulator [Candidatus Rokuibacteriota bacterium]